jgi:intracellular multiplication protein IcmP
MAGQGAPPAQDQTGSLDFLWGAVAVVIVGLLIWFLFKDQLVFAITTLKIWELHVAGLFSAEAQQLIPVAEFYRDHPDQINFNTMKALISTTSKFMAIPFAVICFALAGILYFGPFSTHFRNIYDMKSLYNSQKNLWPQILPVAKQDLIATPINEGPWAMAMSPMDFAKKYHLLREIREQGGGEKLIQRGIKIRVEVIPDKAEKVFADQLGPLWEGVDKLNPYTKVLYAAFVARANHDRVTSRELLDRISASSQKGTPDFSGGEAILEKYRGNKKAEKIITKHAYVRTVMASMLELARGDGVLSTADFLWLRPLDRELWYMLNTVGRQTPFPEVGGIFAHWIVERELGRRFSVPMVKEAVSGLEKALAMVLYQPEEEA